MNYPNDAYYDDEGLNFKEPTHTVRPIVLKQLKSIIHEVGSYALDSQPLYIFTVVGRVMSIAVFPFMIKYTIEDGTGVTTFLFRCSEYDNDSIHKTIEVDRYVRVHARCSANYQLDFLGVNIVLVIDFNEISFHVIETIYHHLKLDFLKK